MKPDLKPEEKNIAQLARDTASDLSSIAANEVRLAAVEIQENFERAAKGLGETMVGAALLVPAFTVFLMAIGFGLGSIDGIAQWVAFLIVGVVGGIAGFAMMKAGKGALDPAALLPKKSLKRFSHDAQLVKEAAQ